MTPRNLWPVIALLALFGADLLAQPPLMLDEARRSHTATVVDGRIHVIGGYGSGRYRTTMATINPATREIATREASFTRVQHTAVVHENRILLVGGYTRDGENQTAGLAREILSVDPASGEAIVLTELPEPRAMPACAILGDSLYVIGGSAAGPGSGRSSRMDIFSLSEQTWQRGPDMPTPREAEAVVISGKILVAGGYDGEVPLDVVEAYDPAAGEWMTLPPLVASQSTHRGFVDGDDVFFFGDYQSLTRVTMGNPFTGSWRLLDAGLAPARHAATVRVGDAAWVIGGQGRSARDSRLEIQEFDLAALRAAPVLAPPDESHLVAQRRRAEAQRAMEARLEALPSISVSGTLEVSYEAGGTTWETQSPFRFDFAGPERLHMEMDELTVVVNGGDLLAMDARAQSFRHVTNQTLEALVHWQSEVRALPPGYGYVLRSGIPSFEGSHAYRLEEVVGEGSWLGRPTWIFVRSEASDPGPGYGYLPSRIDVDQATGLTVFMEATATPGDPVMDCERTGETVSRTLSYRFAVDRFEPDAALDPSRFEISPPEGEEWSMMVYSDPWTVPHPWRLPQLHRAIDRTRHDTTETAWTDRSPLRLRWTSEDCWSHQATDMFRGTRMMKMPVALTPPYLTLNGPNGIIAVTTENGEIAHTWPLSNFADPANLFRRSRLQVLRGPGDAGPLFVVVQDDDRRNQRIEASVQVTAYTVGGEEAWSTSYQTPYGLIRTEVFPRGEGHGDALFLLHHQELVLIDGTGQLRMKKPFGSEIEGIMISESGETGTGEVIVFGRRVQAYDWPGP